MEDREDFQNEIAEIEERTLKGAFDLSDSGTVNWLAPELAGETQMKQAAAAAPMLNGAKDGASYRAVFDSRPINAVDTYLDNLLATSSNAGNFGPI